MRRGCRCRIRLEGIEIGIGRRRLIAATQHPFHNVVDIGEIALHFAVVEHLDRFTRQNRPRKQHRCHIRASPRPIHREKAQARCRESIEMAVGVRHQLVGLLTGGVKAHRMIHRLTFIKGQIAVAAIHRAAGGIHQIANTMMSTALKDVTKANEIALDVGRRILNRITHTSLGCQIHHHLRLFS